MKNDKMKNQYRVNEQIHVREVRVVGENGSMVLPIRQALDMAQEQGVDLVEISPNAQPPVCRLIDYSKFIYQQKKHQKEMKAKQVKVEIKEIRFGPQTDEHDYQFKLKHAIEFVHTYSSVVVLFFSRNKERCCCFVLPTTLKNMVRLSNCRNWKVRRCSFTWLLRRQEWQRRANKRKTARSEWQKARKQPRWRNP